jgi:hypothetical protein
MGEKTQRRLQALYEGAATATGTKNYAIGKTAEEERGYLERFLGTSEQATGTGQFSGDPRYGDYASRYKQTAPAIYQPQAWYDETVKGLNEKLAQAQQLATAGDFEGAAKLKGEADAYYANRQNENPYGVALMTPLTLSRDPYAGAQSTASSPIAQLVGKDVQRAQGLSDRESPVYKEFYGALTEPSIEAIEGGVTKGERNIAQELAQSRRDIQQFGAVRGSGRSVGTEQALMSRVNEAAMGQLANMKLDAGIARSEVLGTATTWLTTYSDNFRRDSVKFAREYVNGSPFVRDGYTQAMTSINNYASELFTNFSQYHGELADIASAQDKARKVGYTKLAIAGLSVLIGGFIGFGAAAAGAGLSGALSGAATGAAVGSALTGGGGATNFAYSPKPGASQPAAQTNKYAGQQMIPENFSDDLINQGQGLGDYRPIG